MPASVSFSEANGVGQSVTDSLTNLNFGSNDSPNLNTSTYKVAVGEFSFEKYLKIKVGGTFAELSNMKLFKLSGTYKTDELIKAIANQTYTQPVNTESAKAVSAIPTAIESALAIQSLEDESLEDETLFTEVGYSKYIVLQTSSSVSTPTGVGNEKVIKVQWDEL